MPGERATDRRFRLRFAAAVTLVAAVPLAIAAWAVGRLVANHEVDKADSSLIASARVVSGYLDQRLTQATSTAKSVAHEPAVQRALVKRDARFLLRYANDHPRIQFRVRGVPVGAAPARKSGLRRSVSVTVAGRPVGLVIAVVPLRIEKAARLAGITPPDLLVPMRRPKLKPSEPADFHSRGVRYRAVATHPIQGVSLVSLTARDPIDAAASRARWRAAWAALATLGTVALLAYLIAPLARRRLRWDLGELAEVEEVPAPVDDATGRPRSARDELGVIVIDDDPAERDLISSALAPSPFHVLHVGDADRALEVLAAERPQLAILDWKLAGRGAELLAELNIRHPDLRVLVVADELAPQQRHVASLLGARDFLVRPLTGDNVAAKVRAMLDGARGPGA